MKVNVTNPIGLLPVVIQRGCPRCEGSLIIVERLGVVFRYRCHRCGAFVCAHVKWWVEEKEVVPTSAGIENVRRSEGGDP